MHSFLSPAEASCCPPDIQLGVLNSACLLLQCCRHTGLMQSELSLAFAATLAWQ